jgi:hypothetical protein
VFSFDWLPRIGRMLLRKGAVSSAAGTQHMERLKQTKAGATARFEQFRDAFPDPILQQIRDSSTSTTTKLSTPVATNADRPTNPGEDADESSEFTARLLKAKQRVHDRNQGST